MGIRPHRISLRPPGIRTLVVLWAGSVLLTWGILVSGWFVARNQLAQIDAQVVQDIRGLDATRRLESAILAYRHYDLLWHATGADRYRQQENGQLMLAQEIVGKFAPYVDTPQENQLWIDLQEKLRVFTEPPVEAAPPLTEAEVRSTATLLNAVHDFQQENQDQMQASVQEAIRVDGVVTNWAVGLSVTTALLLALGALSLIRRIIRPTLALKEAAAAFGQGDFSARAAVVYDDELGALTRTFNNMARDIADREKDRLQFVAMVVHDLKNPMLAIDLAARVLLSPKATDEQRQSYLVGIRDEVTRVRGIIHDLMDDIQVANGRFSVAQTDIDLSTLVRRFVETQGRAFVTHRVSVKTDEGCTIRGDSDRLERVLLNLVSNAVKYSPAGTRVMVRVAREATQVVLCVCDEGPGIAPEDLTVLFQPFGRGRSAHTLAEGSGIGLYVVKQIVEAHAGRIEVHSALGHGATFEIRLPLVLPPLPRDSLPEPAVRT